MKLRLISLTLALALPLAAVACTAPPAAKTPAKPAEATPPVSVTEPVHLRMMPFQKRLASLPQGMPLQIPVMDGSVIETSAPVSSPSWLYTLVTSGTVETVSHWYSNAYASAGWSAASFAEFSGDSLTLRLRKNRAESDLRFEPAGRDRVKVECSIGLGQAPPKVY